VTPRLISHRHDCDMGDCRYHCRRRRDDDALYPGRSPVEARAALKAKKMKYERSFVTYLDFLGFSEASRELNDADRQKVLGLLITLASLRSEFSAAITEKKEAAISTFSDHIVMSYGLETLRENTQMDEPEIAILNQLSTLISTIAAVVLAF
jgi:hypothetical protein